MKKLLTFEPFESQYRQYHIRELAGKPKIRLPICEILQIPATQTSVFLELLGGLGV